MKNYTNYISLGYFCEVAQDLEKMGLRTFSSPFDWGISNFSGVMRAIENRFEGFLDYENLSQLETFRQRYHEDKYDFFFFHDFDKYRSYEEQYPAVRDKYWRRIERFLKKIESPTLFFRYISAVKEDGSDKSSELIWIEENYQHILDVLHSFNPESDIIFLSDDTVNSDKIKIYHVPIDEGDVVSRKPICNNKELYPLIADAQVPGKEDNQKRFELKQKKKNALLTKIKRKAKSIRQSIFCKEYKYSKTFSYGAKKK